VAEESGGGKPTGRSRDGGRREREREREREAERSRDRRAKEGEERRAEGPREELSGSLRCLRGTTDPHGE